MKKTLLILGIIATLALSVYGISITINPNLRYYTVNDSPIFVIAGRDDFHFVPPTGWALWEGQSIMLDAYMQGKAWFSKTPSNISKWEELDGRDAQLIEADFSTWSPESSIAFVYTNSFVDVTSRDPKTQLGYFGSLAGYQANEPEPFNVVRLLVYPKEVVRFVKAVEDDSRLEVSTILLNGREAEFRRIFSLSEKYDLVVVRVPLYEKNSPGYLEVQRRFLKGDDSAEQWMSDFLQGLRME